MSGSDKGDGTAHLGHWGYSLALLLSCLLVGLIAFSQGRDSERRHKSPYEHTESAKSYARRTCVGLDRAAAFECISDAVEASNEVARAEQDLDAQQWMAFWAMLALGVSAITALVTGIGVWYVKQTLDATLVAVKETGDATKAMNRQIDLAEEAHALENRAWLFFDSWNVIPTRDGPVGEPVALTVETKWRNSGQTPAFNVRIDLEIHKLPAGCPLPIWENPAPTDGKSIVGPGAIISANAGPMKSQFMSDFLNSRADFYLFCKVVYSDVFEKTYASRTVEMSAKIAFVGEKNTPEGSIIYDCSFKPVGPQNVFT